MQFKHEDEIFDISVGDEVVILSCYDTEDVVPRGTSTGIVRYVQEDRIGVSWFGVGGSFVHSHEPFTLSQIMSRTTRSASTRP